MCRGGNRCALVKGIDKGRDGGKEMEDGTERKREGKW